MALRRVCLHRNGLLCSFFLKESCRIAYKHKIISKKLKITIGTCYLQTRLCSFHSSMLSTTTPIHDEVTVVYQHGLPIITVPLPSRREKCRFTLKPISNTVKDFIEDVQNEDKGIDHIGVRNTDGVRIASSTSIEVLLQNDFLLVVNDIVYYVVPPPAGRLSTEEMVSLSDIKVKISKLYEVLHVDEHQLEEERKLLGKLEELREQLQPLEKKKQEIVAQSNRNTTILSWIGLGYMGFQFGILARLTWWEYSWDIMEPVTYFITYGTTMVCYGYYVLTKQEYYLPDVSDRQFLLHFHKQARKIGLDVSRYNSIKDEIAETEGHLKRLQDPLQLHLPIQEINLRKFITPPKKPR